MVQETDEDRVVRLLLALGAIREATSDPLQLSSGLRLPVRCNCNVVLSSTGEREIVESAWASGLIKTWPQAQLLVGATHGGFAHASFLADRLSLPVVMMDENLRASDMPFWNADGNLVRTVVVDDCLLSGDTLLSAVNLLRKNKFSVLGATALVSFGLSKTAEKLMNGGVNVYTQTDLRAVRKLAVRDGTWTHEYSVALEGALKRADKH